MVDDDLKYHYHPFSLLFVFVVFFFITTITNDINHLKKRSVYACTPLHFSKDPAAHVLDWRMAAAETSKHAIYPNSECDYQYGG